MLVSSCKIYSIYDLFSYILLYLDENHHEYFYKIQTMNRQLFRNASPIELNFPKQTEFDIEKHTLGQIDHLAIYYSRSEHISTNSLLIHDIRPNESRRRLCLVHRMNELLESIKEKEKARKRQAQAKEDKKLLTQENKKRKKQGEPILLELPNKSKQFPTRHYHHRGRSGLVNLTSVQALALKNRDFLHQNKHYQPKVRSLKFKLSKNQDDSEKNEDDDEDEDDDDDEDDNRKCNKKFELSNFLNEHNQRTVMNDSTQSQTSLLFDNDLKSNENPASKDNHREFHIEPSNSKKHKNFDFSPQDKREDELNDFLSKNGFDNVFLEMIHELPDKSDKIVNEDKQIYFGNVHVSPAVELISTCSHVQNRHLRRPNGDYLPKKLYKIKSSEPSFGYDRWNCVNDISTQRIDWAQAAVGKYFPKFKNNDKFMRFLSDKVRQFPNFPVSRCVKIAILESIADRKYFLSSNVLKDFAKVGQLKKAFRKLVRSEMKYEKYSKNGQRFQIQNDFSEKISLPHEEDLKEPFLYKEFFDDDKIFQDENVDFSRLIGSLPFGILDESNGQMKSLVLNDDLQQVKYFLKFLKMNFLNLFVFF